MPGPLVHRRSGWAPIVERLARDKTAFAAVLLLGLMAVTSVVAPLLGPHGADRIDFEQRALPPSVSHPLGTDDLGRDLFVRLMQGGRITLSAGVSATLIALVIGLFAGAVSGYLGGWVDSLIMRATDLALSIPAFFFVLLLSSLITPGLLAICLIIGITQWMEVARVVRSVVLVAKQNDFVEAARALGMSHGRILCRHILTHTSGPVLVALTIGIAQAVMMESALSFLGFGVQPPASSWGSMLQNAQSHLGTAPWMAIFPGLMIFFTVLSCYVIGDSLRASLASDSA